MIKLCKRTLYRSPSASDHDLAEAADVEAGAADQGAVDVGFRDQFADVVGFDAAAVNHVAAIGRVAPEPLPQPLADVRMRLTGLRRGCVAAGPNRPDRFVRDDEIRDLLAGHPVEPGLN